jgi:1-acyl-sn-glycerol-3-phosphate acyltransferase
MFNYILAPLRFIFLLITAIISLIIALSVAPLLKLSTRAHVIRAWAYFTRVVVGAKLNNTASKHSYMVQNTVIVANHFSWLDVVLLYSIYYINFVGKSEMKRWPLLNWMIKAGGTIFINRNNKRDILKINHQLSKELRKGRCIGFFPEGGVNDGWQLLPFKAPLLEAAMEAKSTIIPVILLYYRKDGTFAYEMSYAKQNLWQNIVNTLKLNGFTTKIIELEPIEASKFTTRQQLSSYLYHKMSEVYAQR